MNSEKEHLINQFDNLLKVKNGFHKRGNTWYIKNAAYYSLVNCQISRFAKNKYYLNLGLLFLGLKEGNSISNAKWHYWNRYEDILKNFTSISDDDYTLTTAKKNTERVLKNLEKFHIPLMKKISDIKFLKANLPYGKELGLFLVRYPDHKAFMESL